MSELVERVARVIFCADNNITTPAQAKDHIDYWLSDEETSTATLYRDLARAAIAEVLGWLAKRPEAIAGVSPYNLGVLAHYLRKEALDQ